MTIAGGRITINGATTAGMLIRHRRRTMITVGTTIIMAIAMTVGITTIVDMATITAMATIIARRQMTIINL